MDIKHVLGSVRSWHLRLVGLVAAGSSLYHLYITAFGRSGPLLTRATTLFLGLLVVFLTHPIRFKRKALNWLELIPVLVIIATYLYLFLDIDRISSRWMYFDAVLPTDIIFGLVTVVLIFEACRRTMGWLLPSVVLVFFVYNFVGPWLPGLFWHRGTSLARVIEILFLNIDGIFGVPIGVANQFIILFVVFGAFVNAVGTGDFFTDLANGLAGWARGGAAKVAVISSAFFGSISGTPLANIATTGTFTIPLMKKTGFKPAFAAAVEASASCCGTILPPLMGSVAFLMAEILGIPYIQVAKASLLPSLLFILTVGVMVHLEACKLGLKGLPREELPRLWVVISQKGHNLIPIIILVYMLIVGYSPSMAGLAAIVMTIPISWLRKSTRITLSGIYEALILGMKNSAAIIAACGSAGIIIGTISLTGLGGRFTSLIISGSGGFLFLSLVYVMISAIILGMGMTITPTYIMAAVLGAPALIKLGVRPESAHLFVIYFAGFATITPPVAMGSYMAAGMAKANMMETSWIALRLSVVGFLIPFMFVYRPELLMIGEPLAIFMATISAIIGSIFLAAGMQRWLLIKTSNLEMVMFIAAGLMLIYPGLHTDVSGILLAVIAIISQWHRERRLRNKQGETVLPPVQGN
jgi:TRAP transporter 4TM/12TM fusion protein